MKLCLRELREKKVWLEKGYTLPEFDIEKVRERTANAPTWLHIGAGNIFRAYPAAMLQKLLNEGLWDTGVIAAECFDGDIIGKAYAPFDNLSLLCTLKADGTVEKTVIASVTEALRCDGACPQDTARFMEALAAPSLRMVSFTITEKGYAVKNAAGEPLPYMRGELEQGPEHARTTMGLLTAGLLGRFRQGKAPLTLMSMDNCSHNGDMLKSSVLFIAEEWEKRGLVPADFPAYLRDGKKIAYPISMIDKITPRPAEQVARMLKNDGFESTETLVTDKNTYTAAFVNAEETEYLIVEDAATTKLPPLERTGVIFTDRDTVEEAKKVKVNTCLNPLHTALAILGCLLGHERINEEMQDEDLKKFVYTLGYRESLPASANPDILSPTAFIKEVLEKRLPNPFMPDTPQRIATDTSQKIPIRFGETLKFYEKNGTADTLECIPFALAAWLRYLMAIDDAGKPFTPSPDPLLDEMQKAVSSLQMGERVTQEQLDKLWGRKDIFAVDLKECGLSGKVTDYLNKMLEGPGAVRKALQALKL